MIGRQIAGSGGLVFVLECKMNMLPVPVTPSSAPPLAEVEIAENDGLDRGPA